MKKPSKAEQTRLRRAVGDHLKAAEKSIKSGHIEQALEQVEQAQKLDPKNAYAHAYKERILDIQREEAKKGAKREETDQRKLAAEAERKRKEAEEKKLREEEEARLRSEEEARKHREEEERKQKEKEQRLEEHLSQANRYLQEGNFEKALDQTEKALQLDPNHPAANQLDTRIHQEKLEIAKREKEEAQRKAAEEERRMRDEEERRRQEAEAKARLRAEEEARKRREEEERKQKEKEQRLEEHLSQANRYLQEGNFEEALDQMEKALQLDPNHPAANQLDTRIHQEKLEIAKREKEEAQRKAAEEERRMRDEEERRRQEAEAKARLSVEGEAGKRREEEERKQKEKEQRLEEHLSQANRYLQEGNFEEALDQTEKTLQLDPNHPAANQLNTRIHQEKLEKAEREKEEARSRVAEEERRKREKELRRKREAEEAKLREAMKEIDHHVATAQDFLEHEEFEKALDSVEKALQLNPRHEVSIQLEEEIRKLKMEEHLRKAEERIKRKEAEEKRREQLREIQQYLDRAEVFYSKGKFEKAIDEITHALGLDSTHPQAKELAAKIHQAIDEKVRVEEEAKRREEEERRRREEEERRQARLRKIQGHLQSAEEYLEKQKFDKATDELKRVYELDPQNAEARELGERVKQEEQLKRVQDHLQAAEGHLLKQRFDKATDELKRLYKLDPENADAKGLEERIHQEQQEEQRRKVEAILRKAEEYFQNGKFQKALDEAAQVYPVDPGYAEAKSFQEKAHKAIVEEEEARRKAEEEAAREAEKKKKVEGLLEQAQSRFLNGEYDKVLGDISRIYMIDPGNAEAAELIGEVQKVKELEEKAAAEGIEITEKKKIKTRKRVSHRHRARIRRYAVVAGITVVAAAAIAVATLRETVFPGPPSLVVYPLTNESGNPREEYIADGLTAALISDFGIVADLKTPGASTALSYKGERVNLAQFGRELRVSHVLSGSARMFGDRLEVSVEVRDTIRGETVWTKEYSESLTDLPRIREDVFSSLMDLLEIDPPRGPKPFAASWSNDPEAVILYLQAMDLFRERTEQSLSYSIRLFDRALAEDSEFALAKAGKAYALALRYQREWEDNPAILETASKLAGDVISSDANIVLAYRTLGSVYRQQRSYETAIEQLKKGLSINPRDVGSYVELALTYGSQGDFKSGVQAANKAVEIDPKGFEAHLAMALVHHLARNYKEAVSSYDQVISLRPSLLWDLLGLYDAALLDFHSFERAQNLYVRYLDRSPNDYTFIYQLARSYQSAGKLNESIPHLNRVLSLARQELSRNSRSARAHLYIGLAQTRLGNRREGTDAIERALAFGKDDYTILYKAAGLYAMQKVTEESLQWFRSAVKKRYSFKGILEHDLFNIRDEAEFLQISRASKEFPSDS